MSRPIRALFLALVLATPPVTAMGHEGVVACVSAHPAAPARFGPPAPPLRIGQGRVLAPVRLAMFFSRMGDRCAWHPSARVRG